MPLTLHLQPQLNPNKQPPGHPGRVKMPCPALAKAAQSPTCPLQDRPRQARTADSEPDLASCCCCCYCCCCCCYYYYSFQSQPVAQLGVRYMAVLCTGASRALEPHGQVPLRIAANLRPTQLVKRLCMIALTGLSAALSAGRELVVKS